MGSFGATGRARGGRLRRRLLSEPSSGWSAWPTGHQLKLWALGPFPTLQGTEGAAIDVFFQGYLVPELFACERPVTPSDRTFTQNETETNSFLDHRGSGNDEFPAFFFGSMWEWLQVLEVFSHFFSDDDPPNSFAPLVHLF